jgi:hypothetical protein
MVTLDQLSEVILVDILSKGLLECKLMSAVFELLILTIIVVAVSSFIHVGGSKYSNTTQGRITIGSFTLLIVYTSWLTKNFPNLIFFGLAPNELLLVLWMFVGCIGLLLLLIFGIRLQTRKGTETYMYNRPNLTKSQRTLLSIVCVLSVLGVLWYFVDSYFMQTL